MGWMDLLNLRKEMKQRTDQILSCSRDWGNHASSLTQSIDRLTSAIERQEEVDKGLLRELKRITNAMSLDAKKIETALERHGRTMIKFGEMLSDS